MDISGIEFAIKVNLKQRIDQRVGFLYKGLARPGTPEDAPHWIIVKITDNWDIDYADGEYTFSKKWIDRDSYTYN